MAPRPYRGPAQARVRPHQSSEAVSPEAGPSRYGPHTTGDAIPATRCYQAHIGTTVLTTSLPVNCCTRTPGRPRPSVSACEAHFHQENLKYNRMHTQSGCDPRQSAAHLCDLTGCEHSNLDLAQLWGGRGRADGGRVCCPAGGSKEKAWQRRVPSHGRRPSAAIWQLLPSQEQTPEKRS